jgi:acetylglutamate kinase
MEDTHQRAHALIETLPYIQRFAGKTFVIKYGGHAMVDDGLKADFARDVLLLRSVGIKPVVVHGGGPQIGQVMARMGIKSTFVDGMRITDDDTMAVVEMVLAGRVNKSIVADITRIGGRAVGLSGRDGRLLVCRKMTIRRDDPITGSPEIIDPGHVGEITAVNADVVRALEDADFIPVIAPVAVGPHETPYNVNADFAAAKVAAALGAEKLLLLTDVEGVRGADSKLVSSLSATGAAGLIADGVATGGMIPKLRACIDAVEGGVPKAHVIDGRVPHAVLLETFTTAGVGTEVTRDGD